MEKTLVTNTFEILRGQDNFYDWLQDLKVQCCTHDLWKLLTGGKANIVEPTRPAIPDSSDFHSLHSVTDVAARTQKQATFQDALNEFQAKVQEYKLALDEYNKQQERARLAWTLLATSVSHTIRFDIIDIGNPKTAMKKIRNRYQPTDDRARELIHRKLDRLCLSDCSSISEFIFRLQMFQKEINILNGDYSDEQLVTRIKQSLPDDYESYLISLHSRPATFACDVDTLHRHLRQAELMFEERKIQAGRWGYQSKQ